MRPQSTQMASIFPAIGISANSSNHFSQNPSKNFSHMFGLFRPPHSALLASGLSVA